MKLPDCYRILGLREGASYEDIKASYRRLARQYHPDANPGNDDAHAKFVRVAQAYQHLSQQISPLEARNFTGIYNDLLGPPSPSPAETSPQTLARENKLKQDIYGKLQMTLQNQRFPRAVALVEGLAQRLPQDAEVRQWQAITYQYWARHLISERQFDKARVYLRKALRVVPHNRTLTEEMERELERIEQLR